MIVFEDRLAEIFDMIPNSIGAKNVEFKPYFNWGTQDVLNKYLAIESNQTRYPLIWLLDADDEYDELHSIVRRRDTSLVIAMHSDKTDDFNPLIYNTDYKLVLNPLTENIIKSIERSGASKFYDVKYTIRKFPNYSVTQRGDKTKTLDVWNAVLLKCSIEINDKCLKTIKF